MITSPLSNRTLSETLFEPQAATGAEGATPPVPNPMTSKGAFERTPVFGIEDGAAGMNLKYGTMRQPSGALNAGRDRRLAVGKNHRISLHVRPNPPPAQIPSHPPKRQKTAALQELPQTRTHHSHGTQSPKLAGRQSGSRLRSRRLQSAKRHSSHWVLDVGRWTLDVLPRLFPRPSAPVCAH
jgi:hypothetical protein